MCTCAIIIMDCDASTIEKKMFWKNSCHLHKIKRHNILANVALKLLTLVIWCVFGFLFLLCLSILLSPKALCWKTSPKELLTLLNNKWSWKYSVSLRLKKSSISLLDLIILLWNYVHLLKQIQSKGSLYSFSRSIW